MVLPEVVKTGLILHVLAQLNAESKRSLQTTISGLRTVKEAVRFQDPQHLWSENVPVSKDMKVAVRSSHAIYLKRIEKMKAEE